jgi:phage shock protein PspC (stress-responsive transcriptional regulator)
MKMNKERSEKMRREKKEKKDTAKGTASQKQKKEARVFRSREDRMIGGVCGGLAEYFNWDPVWVRLIAVLLIFFHGLGLLAYIVCWIVIPKNPNQQATTCCTHKRSCKKHGWWILLAILFVLFAVVSAGIISQAVLCVNGNGNIVNETRELEGFSKIELGGSGTMIITQGEEYSVVVETDENILEHVDTRLRGSTLTIETIGFGCIRPSKEISIFVTLPSLEEIEVAGSGRIIGTNTLSGEELSLTIAGSGDINLELNVTELETEIAGSGEARYRGVADLHEITVAGSGDIVAFELETRETIIDIAGSGDAELFANEQLEISIAGSGDITYTGSPHVVQSVAGSGDIKQVD